MSSLSFHDVLPASARKRVGKGYPEYSDDQARGEDGTWTGGGGGSGSGSPPASSEKPKGGGLSRFAAALLLGGGVAAGGLLLGPVGRMMAARIRTARMAGSRAAATSALGSAAATTQRSLNRLYTQRHTLDRAIAAAEGRAGDARRLIRANARNTAAGSASPEITRRANRAYTQAQAKLTLLGSKRTILDVKVKRLESTFKELQAKARRVGSTKRATQKRYAPMYVCRPLLNTDDFVAWAKSQGFATTIDPDDLHVTLAYSRQPVSWPDPVNDKLVIRPSENRSVEALGDGGAVVLRFNSPTLEGRWQEFKAAGASWDYEKYQPHVTISYQAPEGFNPETAEPYKGELVFGPEQVKPFTEGVEHVEKIREMVRVPHVATSFGKSLELFKELDRVYGDYRGSKAKADGELGLIFGWAIISNEDGKPYYDTQGDHIPEDAMLRAAADFMESKRTMKIMHNGKKVGTVVFAWPVTEEIARAMGLKAKCTGLMVAVKPDNPSVVERFRNNQYTGFSIGGNRLEDEEVDEEAQKAASFRVVKGYPEFDDGQARGKGGQWTASGAVGAAATVASLAALGLGGGAAMGMRRARALLPSIRRAVLARRVRGARTAARGVAQSFMSSRAGVNRTDVNAAMGMLTARGYENPMVNALRATRGAGTASAAARRRAVIEAWGRRGVRL